MSEIISSSDTETATEGSTALADAIQTITSRLAESCITDPELSEACGILGRWLTEISSVRTTAQDNDAVTQAVPAPPQVEKNLTLGGLPVQVYVADGGKAISPLPEMVAVSQEEPHADVPTHEEISLATIVARARLKAESCKWAITRRKRMKDGAAFEHHIKPKDVELATRVKAIDNCYAWPLDPYVFIPDDRMLDDCAGCYEALADAVELGERLSHSVDLYDRYGARVYELIAECCSALRKILIDCDIKSDADQVDAFNWVRNRAFKESIYIRRYMQLDDPADPTSWPARRDAISKIVETIDADNTRIREIKNLLGRIDYTAKRWGDYDNGESIRQVTKLKEAISRLSELKIRLSDPRIRDPLLSMADDLPDDVVPDGAFAEALRYADEYAAKREVESSTDTSAPSEPIPEVKTARRLLEGKVAVLIGGLCRPHSRDALQQELGLRELRWVSTRPHESVDGLAAEVRRKDVNLVMLAIRWSSHSFDDIKRVCDQAGRVFVRLPRGYGVNQVAREIVAQASDELGADC